MKRRPIVFLSALVFATIYFVLGFPKAFPITVAAFICISIVLSFFLIRKKQYILLLIFVPVVLLSCFNPYLQYINKEKSANEFVADIRQEKEAVFTATVKECRTYSSYSQIFVLLDSVNGKPLEKHHAARLGCYSGARLDKNDTISFSGSPMMLCEMDKSEFDTSTYLRSKSVFISFPSVTLISSSPAKHTPFLLHLRRYTKDIIYTFLPRNYNYDSSSVAYAMFAGDSGFLPDEIKEQVSDSGLTHILCVSGMHLAIISGSIYFLLCALSVHKKVRCILIIAICILYTAFTGFSLSTIRACIMCSVSYLGMMLGRKTDGYLSLFLSLLIICLISPYSVLDISLLLSFSATLGIISMSEASPKYEGSNKFVSLLYGLISLLYLNFGAVLFTMPICAFFFKSFSFVSVVSTLAVSAVASYLLISLLFLMLLSPLQSIAAIKMLLFGLGGVCDVLCKIVIGCAEFFYRFRYSAANAVYPEVFICLFAAVLIILTAFIVFDIKKARILCLSAIIVLNILFSFTSLYHAILDDNEYKITYYRKNENDRQLSVKLGTHGYLLINGDNSICTDFKDAPFDKKRGKNYIFIIPDDIISAPVLAEEIRVFKSRFGLREVFLPDNEKGRLLANQLNSQDIKCSYLPRKLLVGNFDISYYADNYFIFNIDDGITKTGILLSDKYSRDAFGDDCDICAFFTQKNKTQFDIINDTVPECDIFFTRLKKDEALDGTVNTFGQKSVMIKG